MSSELYTANATLAEYGLYLSEELNEAVYRTIGRLATGKLTPDEALTSVDYLTSNTDLPFSAWRESRQDDPAIALRELYQRNYEALAAPIGRLSSWRAGLTGERRRHTVGQGRVATGLLLTEGVPAPTVVKIAPTLRPWRRVVNVEASMLGFMAGLGIPGAEQGQAISYEKGAVASLYLPGKTLRRLTQEDLRAISDEHLVRAIETIRQLSARGVLLDALGDNINYDPERGFGFFDNYTIPGISQDEANDHNLRHFAILLCRESGSRLAIRKARAARAEHQALRQRLAAVDPHMEDFVSDQALARELFLPGVSE